MLESNANIQSPAAMNILRASHLGMCFGVRDAIALAQREARCEPLTIFGDLVHNPTVLQRLRAQGVTIERQVATISTPSVMITAHGASDRARAALAARGLRVLEATCPLVRAAHRAVTKLAAEGYHPVIVGKRDHVEVRGLTEDLSEFDVVLTTEDVDRLPEKPRYGVAAQTTQPIERVRELVGLIRRRFPKADVRFIDTVCQPTKLRQHAAEEMAQHSDVVIVIGGAESNNTRELVNTCRRFCARVHHVQTAADLDPDWFNDAQTTGITAGTSTPDDVILAVEGRIQEITSAARVSAPRVKMEVA
jgi:4-hydroxy-3-methylbut-2-enyl diphosphate reductase